MNDIIQHDAMQPFPLDDNSIDVCITSPPYWMLRYYGIEGQIGLESHPQEYINHMVQVASEIKRVLKPTGNFYLNIGDIYGTHGSGSKKSSHNFRKADVASSQGIGTIKRPKQSGWYKEKNRLMIPSRVAIALQDDGWILRNMNIWYKSNPMPSSVKDRLTNAWEPIFHFVKAKKYYYDLDAIREPCKTDGDYREYTGKLRFVRIVMELDALKLESMQKRQQK